MSCWSSTRATRRDGRIRDIATGREYSVHSEYARGRRRAPRHRLIGVEYGGLGVITETATLYVTARLLDVAPIPRS